MHANADAGNNEFREDPPSEPARPLSVQHANFVSDRPGAVWAVCTQIKKSDYRQETDGWRCRGFCSNNTPTNKSKYASAVSFDRLHAAGEATVKYWVLYPMYIWCCYGQWALPAAKHKCGLMAHGHTAVMFTNQCMCHMYNNTHNARVIHTSHLSLTLMTITLYRRLHGTVRFS